MCDLKEAIKYAQNKTLGKSPLKNDANGPNIWEETTVNKNISSLINKGVIPMLEACEINYNKGNLKDRLEYAKKVFLFNDENFTKRVFLGQKYFQKTYDKTTSLSNEISVYIGSCTGYAMPKEIAEAEDLSLINENTKFSAILYPVMNITELKKENKYGYGYGYVYLLHEMMHVLANPDYVNELRHPQKDELTINDEGFNEFFARLSAVYWSWNEKETETDKFIGFPVLYEDLFNENVDNLKLSTIKTEETADINKIKELAKKYFAK